MTQSIEDFLDKIDIVDVISHYIQLKRVGSNYMAPCPFHSETKPSFSVSPTRQFYHCFGCNAGGNAITFIQNFESVSFKEAVQLLSERYNVPFHFSGTSTFDSQKTREREEIQEAFSFLFSMFNQYLKQEGEESSKARQYLHERGFGEDMIKEFQLGYIPFNGKNVIKRLQRNFFNLDIFLKLGIIGKRKEGGFYCKLRERISFPIYDQIGRGIALGARITTKGEPKYLNSPENLLFQKSKVFYGWHQAKPHINKERRILISEGYFDVIRLHQKGFPWSVATLGTSLTEHHARLIKRTGATVLLVFDADEAGIKAALRGVSHLLAQDISYRIIILPKGEDPDSFLQKHSPEEFSALLKKGFNIIELLYKHILDREGTLNLEKKNELIRTLLPLIHESPNPITREEYLSLLSRFLGVGLQSLKSELHNLKKHRKYRKSEPSATRSPAKPSPQKPEEKILKKLISIFILDIKLGMLYDKAIDFKLLEDCPAKATLLQLLRLNIKEGDKISSIVENEALSDEQRALIRQLIIENEEYLDMEESQLAKFSFAYLEKLAQLELKKKIQAQKNRLTLCQDPEEKKELFRHLYEYIHLKEKPREYLKQKLSDFKTNEFVNLDY